MRGKPRGGPVEERFHHFVAEPDGNGCRLWTGFIVEPMGYGRFWLDGRNQDAHTVAWKLTHPGDEIPDGQLVRQTCGRHACVEPLHLVLGPARYEVTREMVAREYGDEAFDVKSYLLGVFDGEGCIGTGRQPAKKDGSYNWFLNVTVGMASEEIVRLFIETWGGNYHKRSKLTTGGLTLHTWHLGSARAIPFLQYVAKYGIYKKDQAVIALKLARNMARYAQPGARKGVNVHGGESYITPEDRAERNDLVLEMRALAGARSRFAHTEVPLR